MSIINIPSMTDLSGFYVVYNGSTNLEKKGNYGISHLMEHLVCKAIDPYSDELDMLGLTNNAYTSKNEVVFFLTGLDESLSKWRNKFVDLLSDFDISKTEFENERNIVLQEYMDSFNDQTSNHWLNLDRKKFNNYNAIGLKEDLQSLTYLDCLNYFEKQFLNPSKIINVSKNIEYGADMDFNNEKINSNFKLSNYDVDLQKDNDYNGKVSLILISDIVEKDFNVINFINLMLTQGLQSPFYQEMREKRGLIYFVGANMNRLNTVGYNSIYTMTTTENVGKIVKIIKTIFKNMDKFLTKERFNVVKQSVKLRAKEREINRYSHINKWINPDGWSIEEIIDDIEYIDVLLAAKKYFNFKNYYVSRDDTEFKK